MTETRTALALAAAARPLRHRVLWLGGIGSLAGLALVLALAAWSARAGVLRSPLWVPAAWVLGLLAAGVAGFFALRAGLGLRNAPLARRLEREAGWRSGAL